MKMIYRYAFDPLILFLPKNFGFTPFLGKQIGIVDTSGSPDPCIFTVQLFELFLGMVGQCIVCFFLRFSFNGSLSEFSTAWPGGVDGGGDRANGKFQRENKKQR